MIYTKPANKITACLSLILSATFKGMGNNPIKLWWLLPDLYKKKNLQIMFQLSGKQLVERSEKYTRLLFWHIHKTIKALTLCVRISYKY